MSTAVNRRILLSDFPFSPSTYPGRRPRFSFVFTSKGIYRVPLGSLGRFLEARGLPPLADRYAILAYGSNACPGQLLEKGLSDVPVLFGRLHGAQAVYAGRTASKGYVPATLARKKGSRPSWITVLTQEQLETMDKTEGRRGGFYALAELPNVQFFVGQSQFTPLYTYVNVDRGVLTLNAEPVSLRSMGQKRAKSLASLDRSQEASRWLDFKAIPCPEVPARYSRTI